MLLVKYDWYRKMVEEKKASVKLTTATVQTAKA
ncbi:hypothetical protein J2T17_007134 [Paenibacillus mucilaginosus]